MEPIERSFLGQKKTFIYLIFLRMHEVPSVAFVRTFQNMQRDFAIDVLFQFDVVYFDSMAGGRDLFTQARTFILFLSSRKKCPFSAV